MTLKGLFPESSFFVKKYVLGLGIFIQIFLFLTVFFGSDALAATCGPAFGTCPNSQTCDCDTTCSQVQKDLNGGVCPAGSSQTECGCNRNQNSCQGTGVTTNCPPNHIRSNVVQSSVCARFCNGLGTAQMSGSCCDVVTYPKSGCNWNPCPTFNNPDKQCETCDDYGGSYCRTNTTYTYVCTPICTAGPEPTLNTPAAAAEAPLPVNFSWSSASWGTETGTGNRSFTVCTGTNATDPCTGGQTFSVTGTNPATSYSASSVTPGNQYWSVRATNSCGQSATSAVRSICVEGFNASNTAYVSNWSSCSANHTRTRTCREDCGTNDCAGVSLIEDCLGDVRGTIFNASDYTSCPAFDPATGYLTGLPAGTGVASRSFGFTDQSAVAPHPWAPLTPATTDANGNYSIRTYAPATYGYDFSPLSDILVTGGGPKLTCQSTVATVPSNTISCLTQPCSPVYNMSFGFWKLYGGWWQAVGGSVHGDDGVYSDIPSSLTTEMSLILPDTTAGNRLGFLSYGGVRSTNMLGTNPNAKVSSALWEAESKYGGQVYDWAFYDKRFNLFTKTDWVDGQAVNYDDLGIGYQIFKSAGSINSFDFNPTGTQKAIFHVNGDIRITDDIIVPDGAFLAVIAKGTIVFDPGVTRADGWYVANNISVPCVDSGSDGCDKTDSQFLGNGSFIGWNGFSLARDRGIINNTAPSELFTYRQDLYLNAPKPMKIYTKYYKPFVP